MRERMEQGAIRAKETPQRPGGIERLTRLEMQQVARDFGQDARAGLEKRPSSLKMYPTFLHPVDIARIPEGAQSLVLEVGGTHIRSSIVGLNAVKDPELLQESLLPESKRKYDSTDEFFDEVVRAAGPVLSGHVVQALGIIWSFPADVSQTANGIDAVSTANLTKELVIPGIADKPLGEMVIAALQRNGMNIPSDLPRAVVNDTAAVLLANGAELGGIVATGDNLAHLHAGEMFNMEAGGFTKVPQTKVAQQIDSASEHPGAYLFEKQSSGRYVGEAFNIILHDLGITDRMYSSADMSDVLAGKLFPDNPVVKDVAETLRDRSAQLIASAIVGTIQEFPEDFPGNEIVVPIDGSFFGKTPGYKEAVEAHIADLLGDGKRVTTKYVKESGMKGAGVAALGLLL